MNAKRKYNLKSKKPNRFHLSIFIFLLLLGVLLILSINTSAVQVYIKVTFPQKEYEVFGNGTPIRNVSIPGIITCEVSRTGESFQYVNVFLYSDDEYGWDPGVSPPIMKFYSSGSRTINLTFNVPSHAKNGTINNVMVNGYYQIEPYDPLNDGHTGHISSDHFNLKLIKTIFFNDTHSDPDISDYPKSLLEGWESFCLIGVIVIISIIIVVFYFKKYR